MSKFRKNRSRVQPPPPVCHPAPPGVSILTPWLHLLEIIVDAQEGPHSGNFDHNCTLLSDSQGILCAFMSESDTGFHINFSFRIYAWWTRTLTVCLVTTPEKRSIYGVKHSVTLKTENGYEFNSVASFGGAEASFIWNIVLTPQV